jgi:hypothetical protein
MHNLEQIAAKWTPLMLGVSDSLAPRMAWAFEQESNYLKSLSEAKRTAEHEDTLKLIFPVLRRAIEHLGEDEHEFAHVFAAVSSAAQEVTEAAVEIDPGDSLDVEAQTKFAGDLADRLHTSLLTFPG